MKKIVIISSTFRKNGNSCALAGRFAEGALQAGNQVETFNLSELDLKFCVGCMACQKIGKCVLNDSVNGLLDKVSCADVLVFATPVYYYCMSGQLKTFLDRLNPLYPKKNNFKKVYLLATAAENDVTAMDGTIKGVQGWIDCFDGVELAGVVYGIGVEGVGEVQATEAYNHAFELGKSV